MGSSLTSKLLLEPFKVLKVSTFVVTLLLLLAVKVALNSSAIACKPISISNTKIIKGQGNRV